MIRASSKQWQLPTKQSVAFFIIISFFFFVIGCCGLFKTTSPKISLSCCHLEQSSNTNNDAHKNSQHSSTNHACNCVKAFNIVEKQTSFNIKIFHVKYLKNAFLFSNAAITNLSSVFNTMLTLRSPPFILSNTVPPYLKNAVLRL